MMEPISEQPGPRATPPKRARSPLLQVPLDPASEVPLYRQVYDGLRDAILAGRLAPGARLPSSRVLAEDLGVARNTVLQAFEQLRSEGYLVGRRGGGTQVRATLPDTLVTVRPVRRRRKPSPSAGDVPAAGDVSAAGDASPPGDVSSAGYRLSARGASLVGSGRGFLRPEGRGVVPFQVGVSAMDAFPVRLWSRLAARRWRRRAINLTDADPAGERALREATAAYLTAARGAVCSADQVLIVNGAQQALNLVAQVLLDPGERVWLENPGYLGARVAFDAAGARIVPVPLDADGLDVAAGERVAPHARMAYVTPSHQFPLGVLMSVARRLQLLAWARRASAWIVEDDYDSEFRYTGRPLPCLQGLEADALQPHETPRVLYVGTFTKTLVPALRLGYLVVPDALVDAFRAARAGLDRHTTTTDQAVLADFIGEGHYMRHIRQVRGLCAERQAVLLDAAAEPLAGLLHLAPDPAGLHLVGWLQEEADDMRAVELAALEGVNVSPLSRSFLGERTTPQAALLLGYAAFDERRIREGVARLRRALAR